MYWYCFEYRTEGQTSFADWLFYGGSSFGFTHLILFCMLIAVWWECAFMPPKSVWVSMCSLCCVAAVYGTERFFFLLSPCVFIKQVREHEKCVFSNRDRPPTTMKFRCGSKHTPTPIPTTQIFWAKCVDIPYTYKHIYICFYFNVLPFFLL